MANAEFTDKLDIYKQSIGIPSLCFECGERIVCGHFDKGTVKLFCECILAWCQSCARRQLAKRIPFEHEGVVYKPFSDYYIECPNPECAEKTNGDLVIKELEAVAIPEYKKTRRQKSLSQGYDLFIGMRFKANRDLESFLKQSLPSTNGTVQEYSTEHQCVGCSSFIGFGSSVLFMCECFNKPFCQMCARFNIAYWTPGKSCKTYESGVYCSICKNPTPVGNVNAAKAEESRLVKQACSELLNKSFKKALGRKNIRALMHKFLDLKIRSFIPLPALEDNKATGEDFERHTIEAYLLEIARMEVYRQNQLHNIENTTEELPLGPLRLLSIKSNPLLETYLVNTRRLKHSKKESLFIEYDKWISLDPHGSIIPLNDEMRQVLGSSKRVQSQAMQRYLALSEVPPAVLVEPQKIPPPAAAATAQVDLVGPYKDFQAYCEIVSERLQDNFVDSPVPIVSAFLKPQDLANAILERAGSAEGDAADWQRVVDERVSDLEDMFFRCKVSEAAADLVTVTADDEEEVLGAMGGEAEDGEMAAGQEGMEMEMQELGEAREEAVPPPTDGKKEEEEDEEDEGEEPVLETSSSWTEALCLQQMEPPVPLQPPLPPAPPPPPLPPPPLPPMVLVPSLAALVRAAGGQDGELLLSRAAFEASDWAALGPFCVTLHLTPAETASPDAKPVNGPSSSPPERVRSMPMWARRLGGQDFRGSLQLPVCFLLPGGQRFNSIVRMTSTKLGLTALINEIECQMRFRGSIEQFYDSANHKLQMRKQLSYYNVQSGTQMVIMPHHMYTSSCSRQHRLGFRRKRTRPTAWEESRLRASMMSAREKQTILQNIETARQCVDSVERMLFETDSSDGGVEDDF